MDKHEQVLEDYLATTELEDCKKKLHEHGGTLLHEHAQSYILLSCLEDEMNGFPDKMKLASRNSQVLSHVTDLAASLNRHPRDVVLPFFARIEDPRYRSGFEEAVQDFIAKIQKRAIDKRKEMDAQEPVELSREERLGPGGLDPVEVFETLPESMQEAFEKKDTQMLQGRSRRWTRKRRRNTWTPCARGVGALGAEQQQRGGYRCRRRARLGFTPCMGQTLSGGVSRRTWGTGRVRSGPPRPRGKLGVYSERMCKNSLYSGRRRGRGEAASVDQDLLARSPRPKTRARARPHGCVEEVARGTRSVRARDYRRSSRPGSRAQAVSAGSRR